MAGQAAATCASLPALLSRTLHRVVLHWPAAVKCVSAAQLPLLYCCCVAQLRRHSSPFVLQPRRFGAEPQFAICGETFPVGCRFHPSICYSQYFSANPDRRKRLYNSPTGVYRQGCGLGAVLMSWGAGEYLHMVLRLNDSTLPPEALFCLR